MITAATTAVKARRFGVFTGLLITCLALDAVLIFGVVKSWHLISAWLPWAALAGALMLAARRALRFAVSQAQALAEGSAEPVTR